MGMRYLFPFDKVVFGESVIIYGYGKVGKSYVEQIEMTGYCKIVAIVDRMEKFLSVSKYKIIDVSNIVEEKFDKIIVALENNIQAHAVEHNLINYGIKSRMIIKTCRKISLHNEQKPYKINSRYGDEIIHIGIDGGGGLGDTVLVLPLLYRLKEMLGGRVEITFISKYKEMLDYVSYVEYTYESNVKQVFDIFIKNDHIPLVVYWVPQKVKKISPLLYDYIMSIIELRSKFSSRLNGDKLWHFARVMKRKRYNVCDFLGILNVEEYQGRLINIPKNEEQILEKFHQKRHQYLVINRDVDINSNMSNFKLWSEKQYNELIRMIKQKFSKISLVRVGVRAGKDKMEGLDFDLTGKTSLSELLVLLKNSRLLISGEGGVVHLNHFLGGKSVVVYGPTDENYFGYEEDIICTNRFPCDIACQYISEDTSCPIGGGEPQCMKNVTAKLVFDKIVDHL